MSTPSPHPSAAVAAAVSGVPGVSRMSAGPTDQFRSYLPGGRTVNGVRFDPDVLLVNVVAVWGVPLTELGEQVRAAVAPWSDAREVVVIVDDLDVPDGGSGPGDDVADEGDP